MNEKEKTASEEVPVAKEDDEKMLSRFNICRLCRQRLLDGYAFHSGAFPARLAHYLLNDGDADNNKVDCTACFGLLQQSGDVISQIVEKVQASGLEFSDFQLHVSQPDYSLLLKQLLQVKIEFCTQSVLNHAGVVRLKLLSSIHSNLIIFYILKFRNMTQKS